MYIYIFIYVLRYARVYTFIFILAFTCLVSKPSRPPKYIRVYLLNAYIYTHTYFINIFVCARVDPGARITT